jgi:hypothetical protein
MKIIRELHQYCLENSLSVVYYHYTGNTRCVDQYINVLVNVESEQTWHRIVIEPLNMQFSPAELVFLGWEEVKTRLDYALLVRTFMC